MLIEIGLFALFILSSAPNRPEAQNLIYANRINAHEGIMQQSPIFGRREKRSKLILI